VKFYRGPNGSETPGRPEGLDPTATGHPFAGFGLIDTRFNFGEKIFEVGDAFQIQIHLALADANEVIVRIRHARNHSRAMQIDGPGVRRPEIFSHRRLSRQKRCGRL
jgi:hypothetical protein